MMKAYKEHVIFVLLVLFAVGTRMLFNQFEVYNFNAVMAVALFGGAYFLRSKLSYAVPMVTMLLTDAVIGFYDWKQMAVVYLAFLLTIVYGKYYGEKPGMGRLALGLAGGTLNFFVLTNFAVWAFGTMYPHTFAGLVQCYEMALPFYQNTVVSNVLFTGLLFGGYSLVKARVPNTSVA